VSFKDAQERFISRPNSTSKDAPIFEFSKIDMRKDSMEAAYFHVHLITDTKLWRTDAFDLNSGHRQKMVLQSAESDMYLAVHRRTHTITEVREVGPSSVWEFVKLPHNPLSFALVHVQTHMLLSAHTKTRSKGTLRLIPKTHRVDPSAAFTFYMTPSIAQAVQAQGMEPKVWIQSYMPYISALAALGGLVTAGALLGNIMKSNAPPASHGPADKPTTTNVGKSNPMPANVQPGGGAGHKLIASSAKWTVAPEAISATTVTVANSPSTKELLRKNTNA
jgi:hypothetical protein